MAMKRELMATAAALAIVVSANAAFAQSGTGEMRGPGASQQQLNNKEQDQGIKSGQLSPGGGASDEINREKKGKTEQRGTGKTDAKPNTAQKDPAEQPGMKDKRSTQNQNAQPGTAQQPSTAQKETGGQTGSKEQQSSQTPSQNSAKSVQISQEQRTKIHQTLVNKNVERVTNVNFSVRVGTRVPRSVRFYPLPIEVISIVPEYRGYEYILVGDEILIIDPRTLEIVAILPA
jgi:hypothetical protein